MQSNAEHKMTSILLVGLSHRTAPIAVREQLSLDACSLPMIASDLQTLGAEMGVLQEVVLLSTCNRLEVYATSCDPAAGVHFIRTQIAQQRCVAPAELECYLYTQTDGQAVDHLMRVAAGLDSLILGEAQILGQVATAFAAAQSCGSSGPILARLFSRALYCGKRARTETPIGSYTTSISHAAVCQAEAELGDLSRRSALVIGAGEMAELAATALQKHEIASIVCINRTLARAEQLAMQVGGRAVDWSRLDEALASVDLVISATAAPHIVLSAEEVAQVMPLRAGRPLLLFDIALPRDIDTGVDALPDIVRYDIDHLRSRIDANIARREAAIPLVENIIATETEAVFEWFNGREVLSTVIELRRLAESIAQQEVARTLQRLLHQTPAAERIEHEVGRLAERIVAKLLHEPTVRLKAQAASGNGAAYAQTLSELFALEAGDALETGKPALTVNGGLHHSTPSKEIVVFENGACSHD
ncbi:MAG: glutamyl-tRNA reductase [Caldilinea sp.]